MKTCPSCGANMPDETRFCTVCGSRLQSAAAPSATDSVYPAPHTDSARYTSYPSVNTNTAANGALIRVCSSKLMLFTAIFLTLAILFTIGGAALLSTVNAKTVLKNIQHMVIDIADNDFDYIITDDDFNSFYEETGLDDLLGTGSSSAASSAVTGLSCSLFNILIALALWITYGSARNGELSTAGFIIMKVIFIIDLIFICICALLVFVGSTAGVIALSSLGREYATVKYLTGPVTGIAAFFCILMIIPIVLYSLLIGTVSSMKRIAAAGEYNGKISAAAAALLIITAASGFFGRILAITFGASVFPAALLSSAAVLLMIVTEVLAGVLILKAKYIVSENA